MSGDSFSDHLQFAAELGVAGVSRDPAWRRRPADATIDDGPASAAAAAGSTSGPAPG